MKRTYIIADSNVNLFTDSLHEFKIQIGAKKMVVQHSTFYAGSFVIYELKTANQNWLKEFAEFWDEKKYEAEDNSFLHLKLFNRLNAA